MAWRVIVRFSLNKDARSRIRNTKIAPLLTAAGLVNTRKGVWESESATDPARVSRCLRDVMVVLAELPPPTGLNDMWIYIDQHRTLRRRR
jgi:hypothetical protein